MTPEGSRRVGHNGCRSTRRGEGDDLTGTRFHSSRPDNAGGGSDVAWWALRAWGALRALRTDRALRAGGTLFPGISLWPLRTCCTVRSGLARLPLRALRTLRTRRSNVPSFSSVADHVRHTFFREAVAITHRHRWVHNKGHPRRSGRTGRTCRACRALGSFRAHLPFRPYLARITHLPLHTGNTWITGYTVATIDAVSTNFSLRACGAGGTCLALLSGCALCHSDTHRWDVSAIGNFARSGVNDRTRPCHSVAGRALRASWALGTFGSERALRPRRALWPRSTLWALRPRRSCSSVGSVETVRTCRTFWTRGSRFSYGTGLTFWSQGSGTRDAELSGGRDRSRAHNAEWSRDHGSDDQCVDRL